METARSFGHPRRARRASRQASSSEASREATADAGRGNARRSRRRSRFVVRPTLAGTGVVPRRARRRVPVPPHRGGQPCSSDRWAWLIRVTLLSKHACNAATEIYLTTFLDGIRVITTAQNVPGPLAAARLRQAGASVTKIEPP